MENITKIIYTGHITGKLIKQRGQKCENCGIDTWLGMPIKLQVHHKDGDRKNNIDTNLQLLCPNCHSYTETYCKPKTLKIKVTDNELVLALQNAESIRQAILSVGLSDTGATYKRVWRLIYKYNLNIPMSNDIPEVSLCDCGKPKCAKSKRCKECEQLLSRKVVRPGREILKEQIYNTSFEELGRLYGVSGKAITKWAKYYELPYKKADILKYSKEDWIQL